MQLRLRHLDQCSAWVKICEVINYGQNKSVGNEPWSIHISHPAVPPHYIDYYQPMWVQFAAVASALGGTSTGALEC